MTTSRNSNPFASKKKKRKKKERHGNASSLHHTPPQVLIITTQQPLRRPSTPHKRQFSQPTPLTDLLTPQHTLDQLPQGPEPLALPRALLIREPKLLHEQDIVLKPGIQMGLEAQPPHDAVMMTVDVRVDAVQPLKDGADRLLEVLREGDARSRLAGWRCRLALGGGWVVGEQNSSTTVALPLVRIVWAGKWREEKGRLLTVHRKPLISIFAFWQLNHFPQTPATQRRFGELLQLPAVGRSSGLGPAASPAAGPCVAAALDGESHGCGIGRPDLLPLRHSARRGGGVHMLSHGRWTMGGSSRRGRHSEYASAGGSDARSEETQADVVDAGRTRIRRGRWCARLAGAWGTGCKAEVMVTSSVAQVVYEAEKGRRPGDVRRQRLERGGRVEALDAGGRLLVIQTEQRIRTYNLEATQALKV
ncbi:putative maintenance of ploidy protein [Hortaea werneckii]|nr:putative maintenance of ploidy protein [Hortaea werneckii]